MSPKHSDSGTGWIKREFAAIRKQMREDRAAKKLQAATIGKGGITIKDGGFLRYRSPNDTEAVFIGSALRDGTGGFAFAIADESGAAAFQVTAYDADTVPPDGDTSVYASGDRVVLRSRSGESEFWMDDLQTHINAGNNELHLWANAGVTIQYTNTAAGANCFIDPADGRIWRSTSSLRRKVDVEDVEVDTAAVLQMRGVTFRDKGQVDADPDTEARYVGFIAEELHDLGLTQFVDYDDEGRPDAISYDRLSVALLAVMKEQQAAHEALAARVKALESAADEAPAEP